MAGFIAIMIAVMIVVLCVFGFLVIVLTAAQSGPGYRRSATTTVLRPCCKRPKGWPHSERHTTLLPLTWAGLGSEASSIQGSAADMLLAASTFTLTSTYAFSSTSSSSTSTSAFTASSVCCKCACRSPGPSSLGWPVLTRFHGPAGSRRLLACLAAG